jgi:hypothetical protein
LRPSLETSSLGITTPSEFPHLRTTDLTAMVIHYV